MTNKISKIVVRNVGVLKAFDTPNAPHLTHLTTIYARNGRGKSTLSSILRSAATGNSATIRGRKTLGVSNGEPQVTLVTGTGSINFSGGKWQTVAPHIHVFDAAFIADNLYGGEAVDLEHDRGLFTVILGHDGVKLAKQQERFNAHAKRAAATFKETEGALANDLPTDCDREAFFAYSAPDTLDAQIVQAEKDLKAIQQADRLARLQSLTLLDPASISDPRSILATTVADIEVSARDRLAAHFSKFKFGKQGEPWVKFGVEHIHDDECPFCGKAGVDDEGMVTVYGQIFGDAYQTHFESVRLASDGVEKAIGAEARFAILQQTGSNSDALRSWSEFYDLSAVELSDVSSAVEGLSRAHASLKQLFDMKRQSPLTRLVEENAVLAAEEEIRSANEALSVYNRSISRMLSIIQTGRAALQMTEQQAATRLSNLRRRRARSDTGVQARIEAALRAKKRDARAKKVRTETQKRLKAANEAAAQHYHAAVNTYLAKFGATFSIGPISNSMTGNVGSVDYGLIVRGSNIARGRGRASDEEPSFKNTLSTGDKTTLAFAFFLAGLGRLRSTADQVIVFDDPLSSHDSHRQSMTVNLLNDLCRDFVQIIVLSHDAFFLRKVSQRCGSYEQSAYEIDFDGENWSKAKATNLDELCRSEHARQRALLLAFYENRQGSPAEVAGTVRRVLETHYRQTYPAYFESGANLGPIIVAIKKDGATHPCFDHLSDLEYCNTETMNDHHGSDPEIREAQAIDPDDLRNVVVVCLRRINALLPAIAADPRQAANA